MATYRVFENLYADAEARRNADNIRLIKDGFSVFALALPLVWLLWHRLWFALLGFLVLSGLILWLGHIVSPALVLVLNSLLGLIIAFEAANLRGSKLIFKGWREIDVVLASTTEEAEARALYNYLHRTAHDTPTMTPPSEPTQSTTYPIKRQSAYRPVIGGFPAKTHPNGLKS